MSTLIIADIAGEFDALMRLVALAPKATKISVGDMCDRGPNSKEVFEYFMADYGKTKFALMGNHEHMALEHYRSVYRHYEWGTWDYNGGRATRQSFPDQEIPANVLDWIAALPLFKKIKSKSAPTAFISHAPLYGDIKQIPKLAGKAQGQYLMDFIWNRYEPIAQEGYLQIFGHNSHWGLRSFVEAGQTDPYAICIDQSRTKVLTGYLYPEGEILEVPF